jgi:hypothetical protein
MKGLLIVALILCSGVAYGQDDDFIGTWLDNFGYTLNLCLTNDGTRLQGSYNEYGLIQMDVTDGGASAYGSWYETSYFSDTYCPYGKASFAVTGNTIVGTYACWDGTSGGDWNASRIVPQETPTLSDCAAIARKGSLEGLWTRDGNVINDYAICVNGDQFEASFVTEDGNDGYQWGDVFFGGRLLQGSYSYILDKAGRRQVGGTLIGLFQDDSLFTYNWKKPIEDDNIFDYTSESNTHRTLRFVERAGSTSNGQCTRNKYLKTGDDADDFAGFVYESGAEVLVFSFMTLLAACVALF